MKRKMRFVLLAAALSLFCTNFSYADETNLVNNENVASNVTQVATESPQPTVNQPQQNVAPPSQQNATAQNPQGAQLPAVDNTNKNVPNLVTPTVPDSNSTTPTTPKRTVNSKKLDLRAVIFDANADFKAEAESEGREMTKLEQAEYNLHESLHGEVSSINKISRKGLFADYSTVRPKWGIIDSMTPWFNYKGAITNNWKGADYTNTLAPIDCMTTGIDGRFKDKKTTFRIMGNLGMSKEGHTFFNDFWGDNYLMYSWTPQDQILVGNSRVNVGYEGWLSPFAIPFYGRSQIAKTYSNVRNLGVKAQGNHKYYDYSLEFASAGRYFIDVFPGPEFVGWLDVKPLAFANGKYGELKMGGGLNAGNADKRYTVGSAYLEYEYKRWDLTCEYASAEGSNGSTGFTPNHSEGYFGTLAYQITPKLHAIARIDRFDPNKDKQNDIRTEYTAGLNYFIKGQALKLMLNYVYYTVENGTYGSQLVTGIQLVL